jgi:hypothetical protein
VKRSFLIAVGISAVLGASASVRADDDTPTGIFMDPQAGLLAAIPGADEAKVVIEATKVGFGEANVVATQSLVGNTLTVEGGESLVHFDGSGNDLTGVFGINQEAGNMNQQANIRSIVVVDAGGGPGIIHLDVNTTQEMTDNHLLLRNTGPREVSIANSFNDSSGIVGINQSAGNLNQQLGVVVVGVGFNVGPEVVQLGDAQLGQIGGDSDNTLTEEGVQGPRTNTLTDSFNGFSGIAQVSQTTGDMNRVTQAVGVSITMPTAP